ncbi:MAG: NAD(P)-binding domain-containing protein [Methylovirgula sp.]
MRTTDIAIIGAGPYGLSISAHLSSKGLSHEIFGQPMSSWRDAMPTNMILRSEPHASNLWDPERRYTFENFCAEKGRPYVASGQPLPLALFLDYAEWFQKHAVPNVQDVQLTKLSQRDGKFQLEFSDAETVQASNVVVAIGHRFFRNMPPVLANLPPDLCSHSSEHRDLTRFIGKDVVVLGAGQSSLETAALLHEQGTNVRIIARSDHVSWNPDNLGEERPLLQKIISPEAGLGFGWRSVAASEFPHVFSMLPRSARFYLVKRTWGPSGAWWLRDRVSGRIPVLTSHEIARASQSNGKVQIFMNQGAGSDVMEVDHVMAATGFKPDLRRLPFLDPTLIPRIKAFDGVPELDRFSESSLSGLFFVGMLAAPTFGPVMRFMFGAKHAAPALAQRFAKASPSGMTRPVHVAAVDR